jgi:hypothetical protein
VLNLKTLSNKEAFTKKDGNVVVDLIRRAVSFLGIRSGSGKAFIVDDETSMRADLISNHFYQNSDYCDLLLKYNGYSNPFSINTGDIIRIPNSEVLSAFGLKQKLDDIGRARKKTSNVIFVPSSKQDKKRSEYLLKKAGASAAVPPNYSIDKGVKLENGKIIFGSDVTTFKAQDCNDPISRTKLMQTLIKNKLK